MTSTDSILSENWEQITKKVIDPLWRGKFKYLFEAAKMDYDDFVSLAGVELSKAITKFDSSRSNLFTFASSIVARKAYSELRNCTQRDKRRALFTAESIDGSTKEAPLSLETNDSMENSELSEIRTGQFIRSLNNNQLRFLILTLLDFKIEEIANMLDMTTHASRDILRSLKDTNTVRALFRRV